MRSLRDRVRRSGKSGHIGGTVAVIETVRVSELWSDWEEPGVP